jgi:hypothetical protein
MLYARESQAPQGEKAPEPPPQSKIWTPGS